MQRNTIIDVGNHDDGFGTVINGYCQKYVSKEARGLKTVIQAMDQIRKKASCLANLIKS